MTPHYFTIVSMYCVIRVVTFRGIKRQCTGMAVRTNTGQSPNSVSMVGQRRIRLTGIEIGMGCDADPTLNRYWVVRPTLCIRGTCIDAYSGGGGRNRPTRLRYTCLLGSFNNYILDIQDPRPRVKPIKLCFQNVRPLFSD